MVHSGGLALTTQHCWEELNMSGSIEQLYTQEEVAKVLSIHPKTVGDWLRTGKLRGIKIGKFWRVRESELQRFITEAEEKSGSR